jgi:putative ABC transport system permease protein
MNIMLVSVTERTREIGVRKALGATRNDIAAQFLVEAVTLTVFGGTLGIALGIGGAFLVKLVTEFPAAAPLWSMFLGFAVSTSVGLAAGLWPAVKAASQDPIEALRYE